jgi:thiol-disulfide isomerase/thioredoxin
MNILLGVLALVLLALVGLQVFVLVRTRAARGRPATGLPGAAGEAAASGRRIALYFWSPSCPSCRTQGPVIEKLRKELPDIYPINIAEDLSSARALGILGTPATVVIEGGIVKNVFLGVTAEEKLRRALT